VSLQYKDAQGEIDEFCKKHGHVDIRQYAYATLTNDYDDTAALVDACDLVICMQTAVAHLCGAIGKECWIFLPRNSQWRYGSSGSSMIWYKSLKVLRQRRLGVWADVIHDAANDLADRYTRKAA
jgi:ADP-heptose:LPS heptosyltransferase